MGWPKDVNELLILRTEWNTEGHWRPRFYFIQSIDDAFRDETTDPVRLGAIPSEENTRAGLLLFTDDVIRCNRELFFIHLAGALSGNDIDDWESKPDGKEWIYSWTKNARAFHFFSRDDLWFFQISAR